MGRNNKLKIISLGGSVVRPDSINISFLKKFRKFLLPLLNEGFKFVIVIGGGKISREYQIAAQKIIKTENDELDRIGIAATRLNAELLRTIFGKRAYFRILDDYQKISLSNKYDLFFAAGSKPGWSTDFVAIHLARILGERQAIIAGKPAYVYTKDHNRYKDARPIPELTWKDYQKICGQKWVPGMHLPVDPIAARFAAKHKIEAIIVNGTDLRNLERVIRSKPFRGSIID